MAQLTLVVPYSYRLSKNARTRNRYGRPYITKEVRELQDSLVAEIAGHGKTWFQAKVWLDIHVEMPSRRSDAINVLDTLADAVKTGIGVDDRWFSIRCLDWSINKENPMVTLTVEQDATCDMRFCSKCGEFYPADTKHFHRRAQNRYGLAPYCKPCVTNQGEKT